VPFKVVSGARAKVGIVDPGSNRVTIIGSFSAVNGTGAIGVAPAFILGRFPAAELVPTDVEPVTLDCSGWREANVSWHTVARYPKIQDLLTVFQPLVFTIIDRQTEALGGEARMLTVRNVVPNRVTWGFSSRGLGEWHMSAVGLYLDTSDAIQSETPSAADLP